MYKNKNITMIQSNVKYIDNNGREIKSNKPYHGIQSDASFVEMKTSQMCTFQGSGFTMSFRREVWDKIKYANLQLNKNVFVYHDILLGLMAAALGSCFLHMKIYDRHRLHGNNVTQVKGHTYVSDRTKEKQQYILNRRIQEFELLIPYCQNEEKMHCFEDFKNFAMSRKDYINHFTINGMLYWRS